MADILNMEYINSIPHPLMCRKHEGDSWCQVETICVQTGCMRLDIWGRIDLTHIDKFLHFQGADGEIHNAEDFYLE